MKKTLCTLLCLMMVLTFAACGKDKEADEETSNYTYEIGMLTASDDASIDDDDDVETVWEGIRQYAEEQGKTYKFYEAAEPTVDSQMDRLKDAVDEGVKVIVASGEEISQAIYEGQKKYPEISFIYFDGEPKNSKGKVEVGDNCVCIRFNTLQAGFLAGYGAAMEGYNSLGFIAEEKNDEAVSYCYGFLQGANEAAKRYRRYSNVYYSYGGSAEKMGKRAEELYQKNWVDAIFTYGPEAFDVVEAVAKENKKVVIASGVTKEYSKTVVTSARKCYEELVADQLDAVFAGSFKGGKSKTLGVKSGGVGLDMSKSKFTNFTKDLYKEAVQLLKSGDVKLASTKSAKTVAELTQEQRLYYIGIYE
ncbi:MAG: BMP family ABC transporter substrate-binding protein [Firmicutes bacterium]|nr:BMP family ABC transporter substrate-binding protein [Bacillota bacterium]